MTGPKSQIKRFNYGRICDLRPVIEKERDNGRVIEGRGCLTRTPATVMRDFSWFKP